MPTRERVQAFVTMVEAGDYVAAIREFYTEDATMQENLGTVRAGRDALVAHEEAVLKGVRSIRTRPGSTFAIDAPMRFSSASVAPSLTRLTESASPCARYPWTAAPFPASIFLPSASNAPI